MRTEASVAQLGLDIHRKFSKVTARDGQGKIVWRQRLEHADRPRMRARLADWPSGAAVVLEGTFGWGWMSDELTAAGLDPHLASSSKVAAWRKARGMAKSNRKDADLLSELWSQRGRWWEVWLAPPQVRQQREWLRYRMTLVRMQTALKNRMHAVLHRHGILREQSDLFGRDGRRFLDLLVPPQAGGTGVPARSARADRSSPRAASGRCRCRDCRRRNDDEVELHFASKSGMMSSSLPRAAASASRPVLSITK